MVAATRQAAQLWPFLAKQWAKRRAAAEKANPPGCRPASSLLARAMPAQLVLSFGGCFNSRELKHHLRQTLAFDLDFC